MNCLSKIENKIRSGPDGVFEKPLGIEVYTVIPFFSGSDWRNGDMKQPGFFDVEGGWRVCRPLETSHRQKLKHALCATEITCFSCLAQIKNVSTKPGAIQSVGRLVSSASWREVTARLQRSGRTVMTPPRPWPPFGPGMALPAPDC